MIAIGQTRYTRVRGAYRPIRVIEILKTKAEVAFRVPSTGRIEVQPVPLTQLNVEPGRHRVVGHGLTIPFEDAVAVLTKRRIETARNSVRRLNNQIRWINREGGSHYATDTIDGPDEQRPWIDRTYEAWDEARRDLEVAARTKKINALERKVANLEA